MWFGLISICSAKKVEEMARRPWEQDVCWATGVTEEVQPGGPNGECLHRLHGCSTCARGSCGFHLVVLYKSSPVGVHTSKEWGSISQEVSGVPSRFCFLHCRLSWKIHGPSAEQNLDHPKYNIPLVTLRRKGCCQSSICLRQRTSWQT